MSIANTLSHIALRSVSERPSTKPPAKANAIIRAKPDLPLPVKPSIIMDALHASRLSFWNLPTGIAILFHLLLMI